MPTCKSSTLEENIVQRVATIGKNAPFAKNIYVKVFENESHGG